MVESNNDRKRRENTIQIRYWQDRVRDLVMVIACGLHNLRLRHRPWNYGSS